MDNVEKNGQPSMEEILASIRRIIAEEPIDAPQGIELTRRQGSGPGGEALDDAGDFELPAIFRNGTAQAPEKPAPLLGRLTDALRGSATSPAVPMAARPADEQAAAAQANGHGGELGPVADTASPALSSLKTAGRLDPFAGSTPQKATSPPGAGTNGGGNMGVEGSPGASGTPDPATEAFSVAKPSAPTPAGKADVQRVMSPFKDTRFRQMAGSDNDEHTLGSGASGTPSGDRAAGEGKVDFASIIPAHMDVPGIPAVEEVPNSDQSRSAEPLPPQHPWPITETSADPPSDEIVPFTASPLTAAYASPAGDDRASEHVNESTPFQAGPDGWQEGTPTGTIEDTTAELLRPMLRQWLADNMPRMVEKALHIEVAQGVKTGKPSSGQ
jgi:cell pole-organizing protein PopZ